jgi:hypothetical protein
MDDKAFDRAFRSSLHPLAAGMFVFGLFFAYLMWRDGERGWMLVLFPLGMAGAIELIGLVAIPMSKLLGTYEEHKAQYKARLPQINGFVAIALGMVSLPLLGAFAAKAALGFLMVVGEFVELPRPAREIEQAYFWPLTATFSLLIVAGLLSFAYTYRRRRGK